ncbi:MAG: phosphoenolpyruvate carboxykinase domain-containing protein, partial [Candidatus Aenigmatarchaeota archaeon]
RLETKPSIFSVNYFLKSEEGEYLNDMEDKRVWLKWMELRVHGDVEAIETPTGNIPKYEDLEYLFDEVLDKKYTEEEYTKQFTIRTPELLEKNERIRNIYEEDIANPPEDIFEELNEQRKRLEDAQSEFGKYIEPQQLLE